MSTVVESIPVSCPDCLRDDVMPSMPQGRIERFLFSAFLIYRFRCRACLNRFPLRKVGRAYVPLIGSTSKVAWALLISGIAASLALMGVMAVKARQSTKASNVSTAPAPAPQQPASEGFKFSVVDDVSAAKKAQANFMNNFTAGADPKAKTTGEAPPAAPPK